MMTGATTFTVGTVEASDASDRELATTLTRVAYFCKMYNMTRKEELYGGEACA